MHVASIMACFAYRRPHADDDNPVVFIHQSTWQQKMLCCYGNMVTLMDATYRTNIYDLPLFVVSVPTNVGYVVVATAVITDETSESVSTVLRTLSEWNPTWNPRYAMSDFSESQISAFEAVFTGTSCCTRTLEFH